MISRHFMPANIRIIFNMQVFLCYAPKERSKEILENQEGEELALMLVQNKKSRICFLFCG